jgi:hypothetical protein
MKIVGAVADEAIEATAAETTAAETTAAEATAAETTAAEATSEAKTIEETLDNLPGKSGKTGPIKEVSDQSELDELYDSLSRGGETIDPGTYPGTVKKLPDGTIIRRRAGSKSGGATIDITMPDGEIIKIHIKS